MSMSKAEEYFERIVIEDRDDVETIAEMARPIAYRQFNINMTNNEVPISTYAIIFDCISNYIKSLQKTKESYSIVIANRLEIGFTTSFDTEENADLEKLGNFMFYMKHIENDKLTEVDEHEKKSVVRCAQWNEANITTNVTDIKQITKMACEKLASELGLMTLNPEIIMPIFCLIHDKVVEYMKLKRDELDVFEYRINMAGCYDVYSRLLEDGVEISFKPCVYSKGLIKEDGGATAKYE